MQVFIPHALVLEHSPFWFIPAGPPLAHACGWITEPGQGIPCDDPTTGPYYCPKCGDEMRVDG